MALWRGLLLFRGGTWWFFGHFKVKSSRILVENCRVTCWRDPIISSERNRKHHPNPSERSQLHTLPAVTVSKRLTPLPVSRGCGPNGGEMEGETKVTD